MPTNTEQNIDFVNIVGPAGMDDTPVVSASDSYLVTGGKKQTPADLKAQMAPTAAETKAAYESNANTNAFTDIEKTKLGNLTITQVVDLDQLETDTATNNAKVSADGSINSHSDVDGSPTNGQALVWSAANNRYEPATISGGGGATNLSWDPTTSTISSDTGTNAVLTTATSIADGLMSVAQNDKLNAIDVNATDDQTGAEIEALLDAELGNVTWKLGSPRIDDDSFATASSSTVPSSESVKAYVDANSGGGQDNTDSLFIDSATGVTTLNVAKDTLYEVQTSFSGNGNNLDLDGTNLTNGDGFTIANNTGLDLDVRAVAGTIAFSEIDNPNGSGSLVRMKNGVVRKFRVKEAGFGTFHYPVYKPLIDEDDMVSDSVDFAPTQQSVKAYVDANAGGTTYTSNVLGSGGSPIRVRSKSGVTPTYVVGASTGTLSIPAFGDISEASIPMISGVDYSANGDFTLVIKFSDNSVNTWSTGSINDFDLYVPQFKIYDIGAQVAFQTGNMNGVNAQADAIDPTVEFGNGEIRFKFSNGSQFGSFPQLYIQLQFAQ